MKTARTFICIEFPSEVIKEIIKLQSLIPKKKFTGKLTEPENLHLTLKFLGEIDENKLDNVKKTLSKIEFPSFQATLGKSGTFSYRGMPRIVWVKLFGKIAELQKEIDRGLSPLFPEENRFMSHLTIARIKYVRDKQAFAYFIKQLPVKPLKFPVTEFKLMSSELSQLGPSYKTMES